MKEPLPFSFRTLRILSLLPILAWPLVFFTTIFFFDDPSADPVKIWALFIAVNAYPIYIILNMILANRIFPKASTMSYALLSYPLIGFAVIIAWFFSH